MRNDAEYQKDVAALSVLVEQVNAEGDLLYRAPCSTPPCTTNNARYARGE